jgi:hypothetical protein
MRWRFLPGHSLPTPSTALLVRLESIIRILPDFDTCICRVFHTQRNSIMYDVTFCGNECWTWENFICGLRPDGQH